MRILVNVFFVVGYKLAFNYLKSKRFTDAIDIAQFVRRERERERCVDEFIYSRSYNGIPIIHVYEKIFLTKPDLC